MPLSPIVFDILVTLASGDAHGYAILTEIRDRTGVTLRPGSLYRAVNRLLAEKLIEEVPASGANAGANASADKADERRTYYRLTAAGRREAQTEAQRLDAQVRTARDARLLHKAR